MPKYLSHLESNWGLIGSFDGESRRRGDGSSPWASALSTTLPDQVDRVEEVIEVMMMVMMISMIMMMVMVMMVTGIKTCFPCCRCFGSARSPPHCYQAWNLY